MHAPVSRGTIRHRATNIKLYVVTGGTCRSHLATEIVPPKRRRTTAIIAADSGNYSGSQCADRMQSSRRFLSRSASLAQFAIFGWRRRRSFGTLSNLCKRTCTLPLPISFVQL